MMNYLAVAVLAVICTATMAFTNADGGYSCNPPQTFDDKLDRIVAFNDGDGDGIVTLKDLDRDLRDYDINNDCVVSTPEWVHTWSCRYGDTPDKAEAIFKIVTNNTGVMSIEDFRDNYAESTIAAFRQQLTFLYPEQSSSS